MAISNEVVNDELSFAHVSNIYISLKQVQRKQEYLWLS